METSKGQQRLSEIIFARSTMAYEMWNYYRQNTDVWVLGSAAAYRSFIERLDGHVRLASQHTQLLAESDSAGMDVLLLPACLDATQPFLLIQERIVSRAGRFNMELMLGGCREGFAFLRDEFAKLLARNSDDPDDHEHVDDAVPLLLQSAVFLNIRGPVETWTEQALETYWETFVLKNDGRLPSGVSYLSSETWDYELPGYDDLHARIPRPKACGGAEISNLKS